MWPVDREAGLCRTRQGRLGIAADLETGPVNLGDIAQSTIRGILWAMNHKRRRPKSRRAGCLLCKPNKLGRGLENKLGHRGFGKLKAQLHADSDLKSE